MICPNCKRENDGSLDRCEGCGISFSSLGLRPHRPPGVSLPAPTASQIAAWWKILPELEPSAPAPTTTKPALRRRRK